MRVADESALVEPLLDYRLRFLLRQAPNMNVVDEGKVQISGITHPCLRAQLGNVVNIHVDQIAGTQRDQRLIDAFLG